MTTTAASSNAVLLLMVLVQDVLPTLKRAIELNTRARNAVMGVTEYSLASTCVRECRYQFKRVLVIGD
jgi:hypothetical protein